MSEAKAGVMTFREHLLELRTRIVRVTLILCVGFFVAWGFRLELFAFMSRPIAAALADNGVYHFQAIQITESIYVYMKVALVADLVFTSPLIFWQIWGFIGPGLYRNEKRFMLPLTAFSVVFFIIGSAFAYVVLLPFITNWLVGLTMEGGNVEVLVTLQNAYSFAFTFLLMFGLVFELPLVIFFLALWGIASGKGLLRFWRYFVVLSFIIGALLTPPDPGSQVLMALPLNVLYGFGIVVAFSVARARERNQEGVGRRALQVLAYSLFGAIALVVAGLLLVASIPQKSLLSAVPDTAEWTLGANPKALLGDDQIRRILMAHPSIQHASTLLTEQDVDLADVNEALLVSDGTLEVFLLRADGIGNVATGLYAALEAGRAAPRADDWVASLLDEDTLVIGQRNLVVQVLATADGNAPAAPRDDEDERLLARLTASGPAWAWLPSPSRRGAALLGDEAAPDIGNAGAVLSLGDRQRLALHLRAKDETKVDLLDAQLEAARSQGYAVDSDTRLTAMIRALAALSVELERVAPAADRPRVAAIRSDLGALGVTVAPSSIRAIAAVAPLARGWSVRQNETWFVLTTELTDDGVPVLVDDVSRATRRL